MTEVPERELVERCLAGGVGEEAAFRAIYERYGPEVHRFVRRMLGCPDRSEDVLQEVFLRLHRGLKTFDPSRSLRPYVLRIARNTAIESIRRRERRRKLDGKGPVPAPRQTVEDAARRERAEIVHAALAALSPEQRTVIVLRYSHGLKLREVAEVLSCTPRTARNRLRAAAVLFERELARRGLLGEEVFA